MSMTPEQEAELVEKMADAIGEAWDCPEEDDDRLRVYARAALAIARPIIEKEAYEKAAKAASGEISCRDNNWRQDGYREWDSSGLYGMARDHAAMAIVALAKK
ncbi:hypothetical protein C4587_00770 [Candidatus Parcubacteria bacterium]|nr:MAG: hypothetical protein C4587_00770 [Candidatus Parcubacteria bacterium]